MALFESMLILSLVAVLLMQVSRRLRIPYPTMLAMAGACVAALPWAPEIDIEPHLVLALFISPALLDAAYDTSPRELKRHWLPLLSLVVVAVLLTTAVVAWAGWAFAGLPVAAALTLGAIVAPPDAAASAAVLSQFSLPRRTLSVLQGESLLNDAVALLLFGLGVSWATTESPAWSHVAPLLLAAVPGGLIFGIVMGKVMVKLAVGLAGTLSSIIAQFATTFAVWIIAERLHLSPIIAIVAYAMTIARYAPSRQSARDRVHSYSVWEAVVFMLNVFAFLLMGLQARSILSRLKDGELQHALLFAGLVLALVILVRLLWIAIYREAVKRWQPVPPASHTLLVSWCGMRGLVTLATAFALPANFPGRDIIVLSAFGVVLGTLVIQGLTLRPLIRWLNIAPDGSLTAEISSARTELFRTALQSLAEETGPTAEAVKAEYAAGEGRARNVDNPQEKTEHDRLRLRAIQAQRRELAEMRRQGRVEDDVFHVLEEELDWSELSAAPPGYFQHLST